MQTLTELNQEGRGDKRRRENFETNFEAISEEKACSLVRGFRLQTLCVNSQATSQQPARAIDNIMGGNMKLREPSQIPSGGQAHVSFKQLGGMQHPIRVRTSA